MALIRQIRENLPLLAITEVANSQGRMQQMFSFILKDQNDTVQRLGKIWIKTIGSLPV
jgi:hypothetical protein